jgi:hypothetical protein
MIASAPVGAALVTVPAVVGRRGRLARRAVAHFSAAAALRASGGYAVLRAPAATANVSATTVASARAAVVSVALARVVSREPV